MSLVSIISLIAIPGSNSVITCSRCQVSLVSFNLKWFLSFSLSYLTSTFLREQVRCCIECPSLWVWLISGHAFLAGIKWYVLLIAWHLEARNVSSPNISDVDLDRLDKVVSTRSLPWKVEICFVRITWGLCTSDFYPWYLTTVDFIICPRFDQWEHFQAGSCCSDMISYSLSISLIFRARYYRIIWSSYCSKPGISFFSKQPWFFSKQWYLKTKI